MNVYRCDWADEVGIAVAPSKEAALAYFSELEGGEAIDESMVCEVTSCSGFAFSIAEDPEGDPALSDCTDEFYDVLGYEPDGEDDEDEDDDEETEEEESGDAA